MNGIIIVSDDLTGATNCASLLLDNKQHIPVYIDTDLFSSEVDKGIYNEKILIVNTNTRTLERSDVLKIFNYLKVLKKTSKERIIFKKIDTAYRGNIDLEIEMLLKIFKKKYCFVINSIPSMGRITLNGRQLFGTKNNKVIVGDGGFKETTFESFSDAVSGSSIEKMTFQVNINDIRKGKRAIAEIIGKNIKQGRNILVFDSTKDEDIDQILNSVRDFFGSFYNEAKLTDILWAGSLGLLESIKRNSIYKDDFKAQAKETGNKVYSIKSGKKKMGKILGVSASSHKNTRNQINFAKEKGLFDIIYIRLNDFLALNEINDKAPGCFKNKDINFLKGAHFEEVIKKYSDIIIKALKDKSIFIIPEISKELSEKSIEKVLLKIISGIFHELAHALKDIKDIGKLILIGGETSFYVLKALNTRSLLVTGNIKTGVDFGLIAGGFLDNKVFFIKGGSVGSENTIAEIANINAQ